MSRLLQHYWTADDRAETRQAQIEDWVEDLAEFGPAIVYQVCRDWRQENPRRPLPSDIRTRCVAVQIAQRENLLIADERRNRWPRWLEDTWGPEPEGPRKRADALARHAG